MKRFIHQLALIILVVLSSGNLLHAGTRESSLVENAIDVVDDFATIPLKRIPPALVREAIFPSVLKAGFMFGGRYGRGVLLVREPDDSWGPPVFVTLSGVSVGHQIGLQATDLVLIFKTRSGLERMKHGKLTIGADAAVAAGPLGRQAEIGTDASLKSEILSYSRSRGLFVGLSLEGGVLIVNTKATDEYNHPIQGGWLGEQPERAHQLPATERLQIKLALLSGAAAPAIQPASADSPPSSEPEEASPARTP
jgi:lipid-binding SYLF domain-containing protein